MTQLKLNHGSVHWKTIAPSRVGEVLIAKSENFVILTVLRAGNDVVNTKLTPHEFRLELISAEAAVQLELQAIARLRKELSDVETLMTAGANGC